MNIDNQRVVELDALLGIIDTMSKTANSLQVACICLVECYG